MSGKRLHWPLGYDSTSVLGDRARPHRHQLVLQCALELGYERVAHNPPFEALAQLEGGADNGVALFYKYLDYKFPGSKFVLLTRSLDGWLQSAAFAAARFPLNSRHDDVPIMRRMLLHETVEFDKDRYVAAYHRHHADVRRYFAARPDDLIEMNIVEAGHGWDVLCPFLGLPRPDAPFPHLHAQRGEPNAMRMFARARG